MGYKKKFNKERDEYYSRSIKYGAVWTFPMLLMMFLISIEHLNKPRDRTH